MALGMLMVPMASGIAELCVWRVITGLGIGGMVAAINAVSAEFSNARSRNLSVSLMAIGYPVGAVLGGLIAAQLLKQHDWRAVFYFGAIVTTSLIPLVFAFVPESIAWLTQKQPAGALDRINRTLRRMGHGAIAALPAISAEARKRSISDIFTPAHVRTTLLVTLAYFFHITTFYFLVKWVPKIVVDMGYAPSSAAGVLVWANVGGALGGAILGLLTQRFGLKPLTLLVLIGSTVMVFAFGRGQSTLPQLAVICGAACFFMNAGIVGLYAIFAQAFPTHVRAFGTGFAVGFGRSGAVLAPVIAGFLFQANYSLALVSLVMSLGSTLAAAMLFMLKPQANPAI
jgi:MFS family permease